nr:damage-inducible protein [Lysobacter sp.]
FEGICLTDTFQMYEKEDLVDALLVDNSERRRRQKQLDIRVIVGNPPYSSGDKNDNNNKSIEYPSLDQRISDTYVQQSAKNVGKSKIYDSYIRAIRWASDRVVEAGVVGFVTNAGFLDASTTDGLRRCLTEEFSSLYVFHLRGNQRTSGELSRKEGGKVFGSGSRAPIAISLLVKNPRVGQRGKIYFHDIGEYLSREEKLEKISRFASIAGINADAGWRSIEPDSHSDWLSQRNDDFGDFIQIGRKGRDDTPAVFSSYSMGVKSNRDDWVYGSSRCVLMSRVQALVNFYNSEVARYQADGKATSVVEFVDRDKTKAKWTSDVLGDLEKGRRHCVDPRGFTRAQYRPYSKQWVYSNKQWNWSRHLMPTYFPSPGLGNRVICTTGIGTQGGFTSLITDILPDLGLVGVGQCFPQFVYDNVDEEVMDTAAQPGLFNSGAPPVGTKGRRDCLTDEGLAYFQTAYPGEMISKEDVFYYVYGLLHSPDYRERYADNLAKELPRIPRVKTAADFWAFSQAGRDLAELHLNYETVPMYAGANVDSGGKPLIAADYRVEKMKYGKRGKDKDVSTLIYNHRVTVTGIPREAYEYVVNGKPALDWVVERQCVKTDKDSGIVNDANDWAIETMQNPRYPLELFLRVITVSLETMKIVRGLPKLDILGSPASPVLLEEAHAAKELEPAG